MEILKTNIESFTHIVHVADIHIRLTKRQDEYREVFSKLYEEIKKTPATTAVFVLGDIVHSKTDLSPESVQLVKDFLYTLSELRPTILVGGNHDTNLANKNRMDSLTPIVDAINHPNLYYLKKSGLYGFADICINNYSVYDDVDKYIKGEDIPQVYRNQFRHFIALYHGVVDNAMTDIGFRIVNKAINTATFDNHDLVLMGDIHLRQDLQKYSFEGDKPYIHYCGSLVQQNHGENLDGHGYSYWDLKTREKTEIEIPNDYGFFTVVMEKGKVISDLSRLPKKSRIQFQLSETVATEVKATLMEIRQKSDVLEVTYNKIDGSITPAKIFISGDTTLGDVGNKDYQAKLLTEYLKNKLGITESIIVDSVLALNSQVNDSIKKDDCAKNIRWIPIRFEWENMFSYGEGNVIDFTKVKDVVGLFAPNASGKSTLLSALSVCIFDKCERDFKAANILNIQKTTFKCKFEFEIDGIRYYIEREGKADRKGTVKVTVKFWKTVGGVDIDLVGEMRNDTNTIIREYLGTYEDFILTALSVQGGKNNVSVIDMGNTDRKDLLAQFMGLSIFDKLHTESSKRLNELFTLLKNFNHDDYTRQLTTYQDGLSQAQSLYNAETEILLKLNEEKNEWQQKIIDETKNLIKVEEEIPPLEHSQQSKQVKEALIKSVKELILKLETEQGEIQKQIPTLDEEVTKMGKKDPSSTYKLHRNHKDSLRDIQNKIERKKIEVTHKKEKVDREKNHQYDPKCKFCCVHSADIINDALKAKEELEKDKLIVTELIGKLNEINKNIVDTEWSVIAFESYDKLRTQVNRLKDSFIAKTSQISAQKDLIKTYEDAIVKYDGYIALYNKNKEALASNVEVEKRIDTLKLGLNNVDSTIKTKNRTLLEMNGKISVFKTQIETIIKRIEEAKELEKEYKIYETYAKAVNRDGIPFEVITMTVPEVEREVNSILSQITNFTAKFETDGKNVIPYIVYDDRKWLMSLTSGFERFALSLAIRVALINISNLPRPNFLIIDEGMGVLDSENLPQMQILFSYLKSNFDFILVISHLEAIRDMVDTHIELLKENGFSKLVHV